MARLFALCVFLVTMPIKLGRSLWNMRSRLKRPSIVQIRLEGRRFLRACLQTWLPALISLCSLAMLGFPGLAYFQVQQALFNYLESDAGTTHWSPLVAAVVSIGLLAITLSAWSTRLIPNFYLNGRCAKTKFLILVLLIGMGPVAGFALSAYSIASLPDVELHTKTNAELVALSILLVGILAQISYYWLLLRQQRHRSRQMIRLVPFALYLTLFIIFSFDTPGTIAFARTLGPVALFGIALSLIVALCSMLIVAGRSVGFPFFTAIVVWALILNYFDLSDGHPLVGEPNDKQAISDQINWALHKWASLRSVKDPKTTPMILVAAEGGGIRAGYVTGMVLAAIADRCPRAANRIFAISGVSGGSVGAAAYVAALHTRPLDPEDTRCDFGDKTHDFYQSRIRKVLAADHLSGLFAKTVFTEPVQGLLPFPVYAFDRQRGLKESITSDWKAMFQGDAVDRPIREIVPGADHPSTPYLLMNTTNIEYGQRVTMGAMHITGTRATNVESIDNYDIDYSLIEAATTSARFPFVSPPGFLLEADGRKLRYTDGGVYDNSGTLTAADIYDELVKLRRGEPEVGQDPDGAIPPEMPILILNLTNTTTCWQQLSFNPSRGCTDPDPGPTLHAITDTLDALFAVRNTHTELFRSKFLSEISAENLKRNIKGFVVEKMPSGGLNLINDEERTLEGRADMMITFALHSEISVPLGWMLSNRTAQQMDNQIFERPERPCLVSSTALGYEYRPVGSVLPDISNGCAFAVLQDYLDPSGFKLRQVPAVGS